MEFRTRYSKKTHTGLSFEGPGRTIQSAKEECDVNTIMAKYMKTGQLPDMIKKNPQYGDFSDAVDYQTAVNTVLFADEQFGALPAKVRSRFENDPAAFLEFATNPANLPEMQKMGLAPVPRPAPKAPESDSDGKTPSEPTPEPTGVVKPPPETSGDS